ncbi:MAG: hypothetical protein RL616_2730 [Verrucomicrobiota bacterium]
MSEGEPTVIALREIASRAEEEKTGARGLMTICERVFRDFKFQLPSSRVKKFAVTDKLVASPATELRRLLDEAGVALVLIPALPRAHVAGVARWLNPHRPLIQLSLYGKTNDKFWFTFFHEAAHVLLHSQEKKAVFLDDPGTAGSDSLEEQQANAWARDFLIPPEHAEALRSLPKSKVAVTDFATRIGIHPGIVVGRLQFDRRIEMTWMNDLKASFTFAPIV